MSTKDKLGWLYPKHSILKRLVDRITLEMAQAGIDKYFDNISNMDCQSDIFVEIGFDVAQMSFYILIYEITLAFSISFMEVTVNYLKGSNWIFNSRRIIRANPYQGYKRKNSPCTITATKSEPLPIGLRRRSTHGEFGIRYDMEKQ